jgi:hypothetical protein
MDFFFIKIFNFGDVTKKYFAHYIKVCFWKILFYKFWKKSLFLNKLELKISVFHWFFDVQTGHPFKDIWSIFFLIMSFFYLIWTVIQEFKCFRWYFCFPFNSIKTFENMTKNKICPTKTRLKIQKNWILNFFYQVF